MKLEECMICGSGEKEIETWQTEQTYYYCRQCQFIKIDDDMLLSENEEKTRYCLHENSLENEGYVSLFRHFIEKCITPYRGLLTTALDFGCGPGPVLAQLLREEGLHVDIYDIHFYSERVYGQRKYDLVTATEVFEHLKDPLQTLGLLKEHLTMNGMIAIMTLFHPNDEDAFNQWHYRREDTHISFFTQKTFKILAKMVDMHCIIADEKNMVVLKQAKRA